MIYSLRSENLVGANRFLPHPALYVIAVHGGVGRVQYPVYGILHSRVHSQAWCLQIQGRLVTDIRQTLGIFMVYYYLKYVIFPLQGLALS